MAEAPAAADYAHRRRIRAELSEYLLEDDRRASKRLLWVSEAHISAPHMAPYNINDGNLRAATEDPTFGRGRAVVLSWAQAPLGCRVVVVEGARIEYKRPDELVPWTDQTKARLLCEERALHLMLNTPSMRAPHIRTLAEISPRQFHMLVQDPLCRILATWGRDPWDDIPDWVWGLVPPVPAVVVGPGGDVALGVPPGMRGPLPAEMFWRDIRGYMQAGEGGGGT